MSYQIPNYGPTINPGDIRRRIWRNTNENPLGNTPNAVMHEQDVIRLSDGTEKVLENGETLSKVPTDMSEVVVLRHPETDQVLGETTLGMIHTMIYSLGRHMQNARDEMRIAEEEAENNPIEGE
jgi:hypothetical protein